MIKRTILWGLVAIAAFSVKAETQVYELSKNWLFSHDRVNWQLVTVPHDWAINGPFDKKWDLQVVAIKENGEETATEHSGRSGALPWIGEGYYRTQLVRWHQACRATLRRSHERADCVSRWARSGPMGIWL